MKKRNKKKGWARAHQKEKWVASDSTKNVAGSSNLNDDDGGGDEASVAKVRKHFCPHIDKGENPQLQWCFQCNTLITMRGKNGGEEDILSDVVKVIKGHWSEVVSSSTVHNQQDGSALELHLHDVIAPRGNSHGVSTLIGGDTLSDDASVCSLAPNSDKSGKELIIDLEMRLRNMFARFDAEDHLSVSIEDIARPLSGEQSSFEGGKVPSEFVVPLTKFAEKYGGGSFSTLFAERLSARQKHILIEEFGNVLYSMEVEEVKNEETFLIWRDSCRDIINWGLNVDFMLDHLKQAARNFFGYMLRPTGSENCCREIRRLEEAVFELRNELSELEQQLGKAQEDLRTRLGDAIDSDCMVCVLESSWTPQTRAVHGLY